MKMQNVPLDQIVWNPWRDMKVYPIDDEHVRELRQSIRTHGFFGGMKARRRNGVYELGCGHHRIVAARKEGLGTVPIFVDDMDDDMMIALMTDENATQGGYSGAAVLADIAAAMRRLIGILLQPGDTLAPIGAKVFEGKVGFGTARGKLLARLEDPDKDGGIGWRPILRYLGHGDESKSSRSKRQVIEAITTLKQSGRYDEIVDNEIRKHPLPEISAKQSKETAVAKTKQPRPKRRVYDDRCSALFPNEHQAKAFREAMTTPGAQRFIPVNEQREVAKNMLGATHSQFDKKQIGASYIKRQVQAVVEEAAKQQREIDKQEKEDFLRQQRESRIQEELRDADRALSRLLSALGALSDLAREFPGHPKLGGFSARLDTLVGAINQFSKQLK
jgi:ParB-like nuclease domain